MVVEKNIKLKVAEAIQDDVNKGIVRIDSNFMHEIGVRPGDIVEIKGERITVGIADRAYPGDIGLNIIRMDGLLRRNAKTGIGELVQVKKAQVREAKKVTIAPVQKGIMIRASPIIFKQGLLGRAVMKGDIVSLGGATRRRNTMTGSPFFNDIFSMLDENMTGFGFSDIKFIVADSDPKQAVIISELTEVQFNPEAVELTEEKVLGVSYEDIGGLKSEIQKVREMVELPLKHPELFEQLGIEPPKGVLLHGPPGTGKTLLAKAVASETNSHFILINGPEIMSKFYGQSLIGDEKVLVRVNGQVQRLKIKDIVVNRIPCEVACFNEEGTLAFLPITDYLTHKTQSKLYRVTTRSGKSITVTADHSLFTIGAEGICEVKTSALHAGTSFIAAMKRIPFSNTPLTELNLYDLLKENDYGLTIKNGTSYLKQAIEHLSRERVCEILNVSDKYLYDIISKQVGVRISAFAKLMDEAKIDVDLNYLQIHSKKAPFPFKLKFTENLWTFFGLWFAEGSYSKGRDVRISIHQKEELLFGQICRDVLGHIATYRKPNSNGSDILISSKILVTIMKNLLGFVSGAREKKVPSRVYNLSKEHMAAFLRGYFSGDGSVNLTTPVPQVEVCTESRELADDLIYLLSYFSIVPKVYNRKNRPQKRITFADYNNLSAFLDIGFLSEEKNEAILKYVSAQKFSRRDQLPIAGIIQEIVNTSPSLHAWQTSASIGKNTLQELQSQDPRLRLLLQGDIYFDKVIALEEVPEKHEYVYDVEVPHHHNFIAGFGGIFAHNSEANLRKKFEDAEKNAPSILFIDEIDAIATKREESHGEVEKRVVAQLLSIMDGMKARGKVVVIAATNIPDSIDPALRRPGRFDREIEIGVPGKEARLNILKIHTRTMPFDKDVDLKHIADITHGFVGADLSSLTKEAAMVVLRRLLPELKLKEDEPISKELLEKLKITMEDFWEALKVVRPSALREVLVEVPNIEWDDIGGLVSVKQSLKEAVEWPLKHPEAFIRLGIKPPKGILLYGPPGTGKTLLAKAVANESEANFILVKGPELLSKWVGESEKAVRKVFKKARQTSPTVIFFDEIDSLAPRRSGNSDGHVTERVVNQLLTEIDGLEDLHNVVIIAATNRPDIIDTALLRPGRFDRIILTPAPEEKGRLEIFKVHTKGMPLAADVKIPELAKKTEGYVGADIEAVCREAAILALRENMSVTEVPEKFFEAALKEVRPSVTKEIMDAYQDFENYFRKARGKEFKEEKPSYYG